MTIFYNCFRNFFFYKLTIIFGNRGEQKTCRRHLLPFQECGSKCFGTVNLSDIWYRCEKRETKIKNGSVHIGWRQNRTIQRPYSNEVPFCCHFEKCDRFNSYEQLKRPYCNNKFLFSSAIWWRYSSSSNNTTSDNKKKSLHFSTGPSITHPNLECHANLFNVIFVEKMERSMFEINKRKKTGTSQIFFPTTPPYCLWVCECAFFLLSLLARHANTRYRRVISKYL